MNRGEPPTALKARTGELTPPGITSRARSKRRRDAGTGSAGIVAALFTVSLSDIVPTGPIRGMPEVGRDTPCVCRHTERDILPSTGVLGSTGPDRRRNFDVNTSLGIATAHMG